jgi:hypothetical protein
MDNLKTLVDMLCDMQYFDKNDVHMLVLTHFKMWKDDDIDGEIHNNDILKRRTDLISRQESIKMVKYSIEKQLLTAKSDLRKGQDIDTSWMARMNYAIRMKGCELVKIASRLSMLRSIEKQRNIERAHSDDRIVRGELFSYISREMGSDKAKELVQNILKQNALT